MPVPPQQDVVLHDRQPARGEQHLHHRLVHPDGCGEDAGADIGNVGELEQTLQGAVFSVGAVHDREDQVERQAGDDRVTRVVGPAVVADPAFNREHRLVTRVRDEMQFSCGARGAPGVEPDVLDRVAGRFQCRGALGEDPVAILLNPDGYRLVALAVEIGKDGGRRGERHRVLTRAAAVDDANAETSHLGI